MATNDQTLSRRELLKSASLAGASLGLVGGASFADAIAAPVADTMRGMKFQPVNTVRLGIIGVGGRGLGMLGEWLAVENVQVTAICDIDKEQIAKAQKRIERAGRKPAAVYDKGERDFEALCKRDDLDFIYIATPWDWHAPMAIAGMTNGKHVGVEVPAVTTLKECWDIVDTSEKTRRHCMIMENCCYDFNEMLVLNMARAGAFGELLHGGAAYNHDLRSILYGKRSEGLWRRTPHTEKNGNLYPTHGLGPVAQYMGIHEGDRFDYLVSMSSPAFGLDEYRLQNIPKDDPRWQEKYVCGDVNTSLIKTVKGRTIMLQHNITTPRPYDRINFIQGTKGLFADYPARIYLEAPGVREEFTSLDKYKAQYEHALWKTTGEVARQKGGHGGMDFIMVYRLVQCLREGLAPDLDVYDAAAWSVPTPLSIQSVAQGSAPVKFPDFTRGHWQRRQG